jgi:hypothetical protein
MKSDHAINAEGITMPSFWPNGFSSPTIFSYVHQHVLDARLRSSLVAVKLCGLRCPDALSAFLDYPITLLPTLTPHLARDSRVSGRAVRHNPAAVGAFYLRNALVHQAVACEGA